MTPEEHSAAQWSAIVTLLRAQMGTGKKLATLLDVRQSIDLWTGQQPAIGVQLMKISCDRAFTKKMHTVADFAILISVQSSQSVNGSNVVPPNLDDANARLQTLIADGAGNGVANVLRDPANHTLGGLAARVTVTGIEYSWEIGRGAAGSDQVWAHALMSVSVEDYISVG
jgi:hypothetical protein